MSNITYDKLEAAYEAAKVGNIEPAFGYVLWSGTINVPAPKYYGQVTGWTSDVQLTNLRFEQAEQEEEEIDPNLPDGYW